MRLRLTVVVHAFGTLLVAGCAAQAPSQQILPPERRSQTPFECTTNPCRVEIDPDAGEWVHEIVRANRGGVIHFAIKDNKVRFDGDGIRFKTAAGRSAVDCPNGGKGPFMIVCQLTPQAASNVKYEYGIKVQGRPEYDPYVLPR